MRKGLFLLLILPFSLAAQQRVPVQEGVEVNAVVSQKALNRVAVEGDRINSVKGLQGQFELDKDTTLGQVFLKPLGSESPIHVFITTEKGHTYHLGLTTHELGAESILLTPIGDNIKWPHSSVYETLLKALIQSMHSQTFLEGFVLTPTKVKLPYIKGSKIKALQSYSGQSLLGQILEISNTTNDTLQLVEADFYLPGVRAVVMLEKTLAPKAKTRVYWVR